MTDFIWKKNSGNNNSKLVSQKHEYILCFAKNKTALGSEFFNSRKTGFDDIISLLDSSKNSGDTVNTAQEKLRILLKSDIFESGTRQYKYVEERDGRFFAFQVADL